MSLGPTISVSYKCLNGQVEAQKFKFSEVIDREDSLGASCGGVASGLGAGFSIFSLTAGAS